MSTKTFELEYIKTDSVNASVGVIIVAAGVASRMGGINKILAPLSGKPTICHTISAFNNNPLVSEIVLVTRDDMVLNLQNLTDEYGFLKVTDIITGGSCREESVKKGFKRLIKNAKIKTVLVHDGARPLISQKVITSVINAVEEFLAVIPVVKAKDTMKRIDTLGKVEQTIANLVNVQTPQGFSVPLLREAFEKAGDDLSAFTDDASIVESAENPVYTVMGDYKNIKITTPEDLILAEEYLKRLEVEE
ncbi:MAG: 2-C-methyl-D-erythritol 4-phosphate cytidylyltransferase [Clostridia bacterium]|nr:2-C-methyl-D-erythritol 4-phosphate cytidylyltransferase [Clostridia bacterium]